MRRALLILTLLILPSSAPAGEGTPSGLPVPRFASLKSDEVNVRSGPGTRYPVEWVFRREGLPVEIVDEFGHWRKIREVDGTTGWVHKGMLSGERTALILGKKPQILRAAPDAKADPLFKAEPMVIGRLVECGKDWCELRIAGRKGWLAKTALWGAQRDENFK